MLSPPTCDQKKYETYVGPIICLNYVVHHNPHAVEHQFSTQFEGYKVDSFNWKPRKLKQKKNSGGDNQNFKKIFEEEIKLWEAGKTATDYMKELNDVEVKIRYISI